MSYGKTGSHGVYITCHVSSVLYLKRNLNVLKSHIFPQVDLFNVESLVPITGTLLPPLIHEYSNQEFNSLICAYESVLDSLLQIQLKLCCWLLNHHWLSPVLEIYFPLCFRLFQSCTSLMTLLLIQTLKFHTSITFASKVVESRRFKFSMQ